MAKYRKKPVVIEAFQMTKEARQDNSNWLEWMHKAWQKDPEEQGALYPSDYPNSNGTDKLKIHTLEGDHLVEWNDFIIQGVNGELYPCKPDIFEKTYEVYEQEQLNVPVVSERKIVRCEDPMVCLRGCSVQEQTCKHPIYER